jgi:hypothetical protein
MVTRSWFVCSLHLLQQQVCRDATTTDGSRIRSAAHRRDESFVAASYPDMSEKCVRSSCHVLQAVEEEGGLSLVACHTACCAAGGGRVSPFGVGRSLSTQSLETTD